MSNQSFNALINPFICQLRKLDQSEVSRFIDDLENWVFDSDYRYIQGFVRAIYCSEYMHDVIDNDEYLERLYIQILSYKE
jgi:hypothetical protein